MFTWKEIAIYTVFVLIIILIAFRGMTAQTKAVPYKLNMTPAEIDYVITALAQRSAMDCILTRTATGWTCVEMKTGKIYKLKVKKAAAAKPNLAAN